MAKNIFIICKSDSNMFIFAPAKTNGKTFFKAYGKRRYYGGVNTEIRNRKGSKNKLKKV